MTILPLLSEDTARLIEEQRAEAASDLIPTSIETLAAALADPSGDAVEVALLSIRGHAAAAADVETWDLADTALTDLYRQEPQDGPAYPHGDPWAV